MLKRFALTVLGQLERISNKRAGYRAQMAWKSIAASAFCPCDTHSIGMPDAATIDRPSTGSVLASQRKGSRSFYRPELDGLRFFCFLAVFIGHSWPINPLRQPIESPAFRELYSWLWSIPQAGDAGVDVFFTLSAFLITELLLREWQLMGRIDIGAFYCRRALRIWPLYYTFLLLAWLIEPRVGMPGLSPGFLVADAAFVGNWMMA